MVVEWKAALDSCVHLRLLFLSGLVTGLISSGVIATEFLQLGL